MSANRTRLSAAAAALFGLTQVASAPLLAQDTAPFEADPPKACGPCDGWNAPLEPFRIFGNTWYVGTAGLSAILVTTEGGLVLLDGGLPQSAALIERNIRALGFATEDLRLILNSHAHYDHAGGIAALARASGARVAASPAGAAALEQGGPTADDPQFALGREANAFPPVPDVVRVEEGVALTVGGLAMTPVFTPGHTPGGTTWTWRACEGERCLTMVYADSLTAVSADGYRYTDAPELLAAFEASIAKVAELPCDVLVSTHPVDLAAKREQLLEGQGVGANPFVQPGACRDYGDRAAAALERRVARER